MLRDAPSAGTMLVEADEILTTRELGSLQRRRDRLAADVAAIPAGEEGQTIRLSRAELRLLPLLGTHLSFREIGAHLFLSRHTVKTQAISAYRKLGASSRPRSGRRSGPPGADRGPHRPGGLNGRHTGSGSAGGAARHAATVAAPTVAFVTAPAGYGKTTLLAQVAAATGRKPFASLAIGERDNDPRQLVAALCAALGIEAGSAKSLASAIADGGALDVSIDDLHLLSSERSLDVLCTVARSLPPRSRLLLAAGHAPRTRLPRP